MSIRKPTDLIAAAEKVIDAMQEGSDGMLPPEILVLDGKNVAIVQDIQGVDYILTMQALPRQRKRPAKN